MDAAERLTLLLLLSGYAAEDERLTFLTAVADARFERAVALPAVSDHLRKIVRRILEGRTVGGDFGQHEVGGRTSIRLRDIDESAVALDDSQEFECDHAIGLQRPRHGEHRAAGRRRPSL